MNRTVQTERKKEQRRTIIALAAAVLIHLLIVLAAVILLSLHPDWKKKFEPKPPEPEPVEFTMIPPPEPPPLQKEFFDSAEGQVTEKAPENPSFESDQNTLAASKLPPQSNLPVPTTDGTDEGSLTLTARDLSLGPAKQPSPSTPAAPARDAQPPQKEPAKPEPQKPEEKPEEKPDEKPKPTPKPLPEDSELAMLNPSRPQPKPVEEKPKVEPEKPSSPSRPQPPSFQPQTRVTRLTGGISSTNQTDRASLASVATPLGKYKKMISDAIGSRWYYYVNDMIDLVNVGTVQLRFRVRQDGTVEGVQVLRNNSNESLASCSVRAVIEAEIPPMTKEVSAVLAGSQLEIDYSFTVGRSR